MAAPAASNEKAAAAAAADKPVSVPSTAKAGPVPAYLYPSVYGTKKPALIILQEWWGINQQIKDKAKELSKTLTTFVPDLYRGKVATDNETAGHLMNNLDWPGAIADVKGCVAYLKAQGYGKVYVVGYCMGGALSLASAVLLGNELSGATVFYGIPDAKLADPNKLTIPVQCHFGTLDEYKGFSDTATAKALEETLKKIKAAYEFYHYEGLHHAFTNSTGKNYDAKGSALAHERMLKWIAKTSTPAGTAASVPSDNKAGPVPSTVYPAHNADAKAVAKPALIVIQEWWGVNPQILSRAHAFAQRGLTTLVPDLYRGKVAENEDEAHHYMSGLDWPGAVADIKGAAKYLRAQGHTHVFVTGYCMGGALALASAVLFPDVVTGGIPYYGIPQKALADPVNLKVPVQCHFGANDNYPGFSDAKAAGALEATLKQIKATYEFYNYEGCGHAFTREDGPNYNHTAAEQAFERTVAFVAKHSAPAAAAK